MALHHQLQTRTAKTIACAGGATIRIGRGGWRLRLAEVRQLSRNRGIVKRVVLENRRTSTRARRAVAHLCVRDGERIAVNLAEYFNVPQRVKAGSFVRP